MKLNYEVIILAAGNSSRMLPITRDFPKCLLQIGGKTILEHQISAFKKHGLKRFNIVLGYKYKKVLPFILKEDIHVIYNKFYNKSNSMYSLWLTKKRYNTHIIIVNSDLYFEERLMDRILTSGNKNIAIIDKSAKWDLESTKVKIQNGKIKYWSRNIPEGEFSGENLGIVKITKKDVQSFYNIISNLIKKKHYKIWWPEALNRLVKASQIYAVYNNSTFCKEIDTQKDYQYVLKQISKRK